MSKLIDLTGKTFSRLTVIERSENTKRGNARWKCKCSCGNTSIVVTGELTSGGTKSCGCLRHRTPANFIDLTGQNFGKLRVTHRGTPRKYWNARWVCECECGNSLTVYSSNLVRGLTTSCGCTWLDAISTHGKSDIPEYSIWAGMVQRCYNPANKGFKNYGGRGITVCEEWRNDFMPFFNHVGPRPSAIHSIDRIDNSGNYEPGNVHWSTAEEQANNMRSNHIVTFNGKSMNLAQWAKTHGMKYSTLYARISRGWSIGKALTRPV